MRCDSSTRGVNYGCEESLSQWAAERNNIVDDERDWRVARQTSAMPLSAAKVVATRWHACSARIQEFGAETPADQHVVKIVLRNTNIRFSVSGRTVQDGLTTPGTVHVTEPAAPVHCLFRGPYDVLHLHIPNQLIAECARDMTSHLLPVLVSKSVPSKDATVESLARALFEADRVGGSFGQIYADCISMAIVARLLASANRGAGPDQPKAGKLARWRLKRAIDYVEAHLDNPVSLADVASSAGLTRMHFAAQFRAATGLRPHEYLLRRRIERAQEMLVGTSMPLVDIALSVGFQTQSHFTRVFKRYAGQPPRAWRESHGGRNF
ncbi:MAG: AraC family transcriptional regulator [Gammaproteobacteria bacterium]|jgi:AraC-like DNA-binding protein|nr:AraC family transcriptional regulator [Gammaproteobacteria bacterium]